MLLQGAWVKNKMAHTVKDPCPRTAFSVSNRNKTTGEGEGENFSMLTHATVRGMGKNMNSAGNPSPLCGLNPSSFF